MNEQQLQYSIYLPPGPVLASPSRSARATDTAHHEKVQAHIRAAVSTNFMWKFNPLSDTLVQHELRARTRCRRRRRYAVVPLRSAGSVYQSAMLGSESHPVEWSVSSRAQLSTPLRSSGSVWCCRSRLTQPSRVDVMLSGRFVPFRSAGSVLSSRPVVKAMPISSGTRRLTVVRTL